VTATDSSSGPDALPGGRLEAAIRDATLPTGDGQQDDGQVRIACEAEAMR
jgi:hypothetical protein